MTEHWQLHYPDSQFLLPMQEVKFIVSVVGGFVAQGRDRAPDDLHVFGPNFYWQVLKNTCGNTKVYSSSLLSPAEAQALLQGKASQKWLKPYRWGINKTATIPISKLFRAASTVSNILLPAVYPGSFGLQTLPEIFQELHALLRSAPIDIHLQQHNQDLVGFFTSLPIEQIMESVNHLATQYAAKQSADWSETSLTKLRAYQG